MKIILTHNPKNISNKITWLYFGSSSLKMKQWENKLSGNRINLQNEIHDQAKIQKKPFIEWIESQRIANKDSIYWWMTQIAGRNNSYSNFFLNLCQFFAIKEYLDQNSQNNEILIVCEDYFLVKFLEQNLSEKFKIKIPIFLKFYLFKNLFFLLFKGLIVQFKLTYIFFINYLYAKLTSPKQPTHPTGDVCLFHHCLDKTDSFQNSNIVCKYLTVLPSWLEKQNVKVFGLPWLFNNKPTINFYKDLRKSSCLIPEDWLSLKDYFYIFKSSLKSLSTLKYNILYPESKINFLIFRERISQLSEQNVLFWRYIPAIKKWSSKLKSITAYDRYENGISEHSIRYIIKKLPIKSTSIGYYHSLVSNEYMVYQHSDTEWFSQVKPDYIACSGKIAKDILLNHGVPEKKLLSTVALRQPHSEYSLVKKKSKKQLLILLPIGTEDSSELLTKLYLNNSLIIEKLKLKVKVKNHPMVKHKDILKKIRWNELPYGWEWTNKSLYSELDDSYCCAAVDTASVFDAIFRGNIVIPIMSDLKLMDNYLDFLTPKYPIVCSVPEKKLDATLINVFSLQTSYYESEFSKIRKELIEGINPINSAQIQNFKID